MCARLEQGSQPWEIMVSCRIGDRTVDWTATQDVGGNPPRYVIHAQRAFAFALDPAKYSHLCLRATSRD